LYWQSVGGQLEIWQREAPVGCSTIRLEPKLKAQLERALRIREYASRELGLPDNPVTRLCRSARPFVVWNVFAAPEFRQKRGNGVFLAGCVGYRYFSEAEARAQAKTLAAEGYDVHVGGVPAYSTIGWFADPLLNTFIHYPEPELARLLFHELAHQVVYVKDDTVFNESFATVVEQAGVARWMNTQGSDADRLQFAKLQRFRGEFRELVMRTRGDLEKLYAGDAPIAEKRRRKAEAFEALKRAYAAQRQDWGGFAGYDAGSRSRWAMPISRRCPFTRSRYRLLKPC
jgi:predicted aminopeptidase